MSRPSPARAPGRPALTPPVTEGVSLSRARQIADGEAFFDRMHAAQQAGERTDRGPVEGIVGLCTVTVTDDGRELPEHLRRAFAALARTSVERQADADA